MTIKDLLNEYHDNKIFSDDQIGEIQSVIIPTVIDIVIGEIDKLQVIEHVTDDLTLVNGKIAKKEDIRKILNDLKK